MRILIAEDEPSTRRMLEAILVGYGYYVVSTCDGLEAWQRLQCDDPPELAVLDLIMPSMDGLELCQQIRSSPYLHSTYIIMLTVKGRKEDILAGFNAGADDYITKPFDREQLRARIGAGARIVALQKNLARRIAELERSNAELEQFAYVCSHDLREPLRKIQAFSGRLRTDFEEVLDERGRDYLQRVQNAGGRMQRLIDDLLEYSRVTTQTQQFVPVDLAQVAQEVVSDLDVSIEQTGGCVTVGDMPTIDSDPTQMRQLLQNLIGNGLKYHKEEEPPAIEVYAELFDSMCQITVEDNGIGFDEKHAFRIFDVFQRLHGRLDYEGTGIGLAVCRKIVEHHGGSIAAKSALGQGATFTVTLPVKQYNDGYPIENEKELAIIGKY